MMRGFILSCKSAVTALMFILTLTVSTAAANDYYGYFDKDKYYRYGSNKFEENLTCSFSDMVGGPECISGNLINWAAMSRIDLLRKALIGGKAVSAQGNVYTLRGEGGWRTFSDQNLACTFTIDGGSSSNLDHKIGGAVLGFRRFRKTRLA